MSEPSPSTLAGDVRGGEGVMPRHVVLAALAVAVAGGVFVSPVAVGALLVVAGLLPVVGGRPRLPVYVWVVSVLLYAYQVDVAGISVNPYRVGFLAVLGWLPVYTFMRWRSGRIPRRDVLGGMDAYSAAVLGLVTCLVLLSWLRTPTAGLSQAATEIYARLFDIGVLVVLLAYIRNMAQVRKVVWVYVGMATTAGAFGLYEGLGWFLTGSRPTLPFDRFAVEEVAQKSSVVGGLDIPRVESFFHDANFLAITLAFAVIVAVARLAGTRDRRKRWLLYAIAVVNTSCIFLTVSRSGIGAVVLGVLLLKLRRDPRTALWIGGIAALGAMVLLSAPEGTLIALYREGVLGRFTQGGVGSQRIALGTIGLEAFADAPFAGKGIGGLWVYHGIRTTHSWYLSVIAEYGLVGLGVVALLLGRVVRSALRAIASPRGDLDLALAIVVIVLLGFQVVYDSLFSELMWLPFGIVYCWATLRREEDETGTGRAGVGHAVARGE